MTPDPDGVAAGGVPACDGFGEKICRKVIMMPTVIITAGPDRGSPQRTTA